MGPSFSFKGFDNNIYYMLTPDGNYYNFSGCGNTLNCNHPIVQQMILECLRYWTISYRIDGFRFDLATILGRNEDGSPMNNPPLLKTLACDPVLSNVKLIAEAWDAGGMYQVGSFPANHRWAEWNGRYRNALRSFLKGDFWQSWDAAWSISGSGDLYGGYYSHSAGNYAGYNSCVNFLTCHDGFTLYDLYSYNEKHNECNGWNNTDGCNDNRSWNCGAEGDTNDPEVLKLRYRMIRNACAVLMCSRGTPMFLAGDEFGNTQYGNNNSYCQDNEISWLDWSLLAKNQELFSFFQYMIRFRKRHPIIRKKLPDAVCGWIRSIRTTPCRRSRYRAMRIPSASASPDITAQTEAMILSTCRSTATGRMLQSRSRGYSTAVHGICVLIPSGTATDATATRKVRRPESIMNLSCARGRWRCLSGRIFKLDHFPVCSQGRDPQK